MQPRSLISLLIFLLLVVGLLLMSGCSLFTKVVKEPYPVYSKIECGSISPARGLKPETVTPYVVESGNGTKWVAFSPEDYKRLAINNKDIVRYIKDQNGIIKIYVECVSDYNSQIDKVRKK